MGLFVKEFSTGGKSLAEVSWLDRFRPPVAGFDSPGDNPILFVFQRRGGSPVYIKVQLLSAAPLKNKKEGIIGPFFYKQVTPNGVWAQKSGRRLNGVAAFPASFPSFLQRHV
jgi:hypothetical protein